MILKRVYKLLLCVLFSGLIIGSLFLILAINKRKSNHFVRLLPSRSIIPKDIFDLKSTGWYVAGFDQKYIYLGNAKGPHQIVEINLNTKKIFASKIMFHVNTHQFEGCFNYIDSGMIYNFDGVKPSILTGDLSDKTFRTTYKPPYFTQAILTQNKSFILRTIVHGENKLIKYRADLTILEKPSNLLEKQVDGMFCTDGILIKVPNSNRLFYVYYYRNQFICADSNLNLLYKGKTIDTVSKAKIKIAYIKKLDQTTLAAPPLYVNKQSTANEKYLFIHSALRADNEVKGSLDKLSVIDVYQIIDGKYKFSFYLPDFNGKKLTDFRVYGKNLYALFDHYLYKYQLNF